MPESSQLGFRTPGMRRALPARRKRDGKPKQRVGRPPGSGAARAHHARPALSRHHAVYVTLRVDPIVRSLRTRKAYQAFHHALGVVAATAHRTFRIVHISLEADHVHLLCEADNSVALARGMNGFVSCAARRINRTLGRARGKVFPHRYHAQVIKSPRQARNTLAYVLNNWRRHRHGWVNAAPLDRFSSASSFDGWLGRAGGRFTMPTGHDPLPVAAPRTWLLRIGWRARHPLIAPTEVPRLQP